MLGNSSLLHNIRVLDFTHVLAGPFCTYQLAVMGADVIKIESSECIDMMRFNGPDTEHTNQDMSLHYQAQSSNKRAMTLNLKHAEAQLILDRLLKSADVLVVNYRKKAAKELLIDYERVKSINPRIVYCSLTGFGQTGPKSDHPAYDNVIQAFSGLMAATGTDADGPTRVGPPVLDYGTGAQAALAIVGSLFQRERENVGNFIDVAMLDAALMLMSSSVTETAKSSVAPKRPGNRSVRASYGCYKTKLGELMIGAYTQTQISNMWRALQLPEKATAVSTLDVHQLDEAYDDDTLMLENMLLQKSADEWETLLNDADVPAARVRSLNETLGEAQVQSRNVLQHTVTHIEAQSNYEHTGLANSQQDMVVPVSAWQSEFASPKINTAPPKVGEHTAEILNELGFTEEEIVSLCLGAASG